ncbi:hypothetical protein SAMN02745857_03801 [Andreprevotia lacus DSM 23236]|uniref:Uncharacterized protein n=1 Tax=Andreprevotia lacus DSM 23236 TaxID=1121001 RepID=A0A1W1XZT3_9NEIS|nr:hypothetical protein [Andreprevotia lacus]SMC29385.1 hypothetical protein SAMN02745857_03801 [Andreprevotia lacus DSM 23236]
MDELAWFRAADNSPAMEWVALGLGKQKQTISIQPPTDIESYRLDKPLSRWRRNYIAALKIAELELSDLPPLQRVLELLRWMHDDFILAGPAAMLACIYFAPFSPPRSGLFKSLRSLDRQRAINGVKNAAWDLTHISDFVRRISAERGGSTRYVLASGDAGLRAVARIVVPQTNETEQFEQCANVLAQWWPSEDAKQISLAAADYFSRGRDASWLEAHKHRPNLIADLTNQGEQLLLGWQDGQKQHN